MILQMGWFMAEYANHAHVCFFPNENEKKRMIKRSIKIDDFHRKWKIKTHFWVGKMYVQYQRKIANIYWCVRVRLFFSHSHIRSHTLTHSFLSRILRFSLFILECNKILSFVSFPFNDAMKYVQVMHVICLMRYMYTRIILPFLFLSNNLTLIDSVRIVFSWLAVDTNMRCTCTCILYTI